MNVEIRTEIAQFVFGEYLNRIFFAACVSWYFLNNLFSVTFATSFQTQLKLLKIFQI
jgi:hypothetical protein